MSPGKGEKTGALREFPAFKADALFTKESKFLLNCRSTPFTFKSTHRQIRCNDPVAGNPGRKGIPTQRLAHRSGRTAPYPGGNSLIGSHLSLGDHADRVIDTLLKRRHFHGVIPTIESLPSTILDHTLLMRQYVNRC